MSKTIWSACAMWVHVQCNNLARKHKNLDRLVQFKITVIEQRLPKCTVADSRAPQKHRNAHSTFFWSSILNETLNICTQFLGVSITTSKGVCTQGGSAVDNLASLCNFRQNWWDQFWQQWIKYRTQLHRMYYKLKSPCYWNDSSMCSPWPDQWPLQKRIQKHRAPVRNHKKGSIDSPPVPGIRCKDLQRMYTHNPSESATKRINQMKDEPRSIKIVSFCVYSG